MSFSPDLTARLKAALDYEEFSVWQRRDFLRTIFPPAVLDLDVAGRPARVFVSQSVERLTLESAEAAYIAGDIEADEFERKVEAIMRADEWGWAE